MNTQRTAARLISLVSAAFLTLVMLASVNVLATSEPGVAQMAQAAASSKS